MAPPWHKIWGGSSVGSAEASTCAVTFCIYDGPSPEAIRQVAKRNALPVESITEVPVLAPYFYH